MKLLLGALLAVLSTTALRAETGPVTLDVTKPYAKSDYAFLSPAIGSSQVVALGESIHVTREMPRVRLQIVRYLHEELGFNVIAFEGSLLDAWTAQEHAYRASGSLKEGAATMKLEIFFGLWQTAPMQEVLEYALSTRSTAHPLYVTSFDLQPGTARAYGGSTAESLRAFFAAVAPYDPAIDPGKIKQWNDKLATALDCAKEANASQLVDEIEAWLNGPIAVSLARARPAVHIAALRLIPVMLRNRLQLCQDWTADQRSMITYQRVRDELNTQLVLNELKMLPSPAKLILWAHHSHLHYNSLGKTIPSMGQHLHDILHWDIYSIGVFAQSGSAIDTATIDQAHGLGFLFALAPKPIPHGPRWSVEEQLSQLSPHDFFLDLRHAATEWAAPGTSRLENNGRMATALSADFDGAILLHRVSGVELDFLPGWLRASARSIGFIIARPIISAALMVMLLTGLIYLVRRRPSPSS
ncbi:MAG: erythromycin esterase family protein [Chthoniobacterales bacterium]